MPCFAVFCRVLPCVAVCCCTLPCAAACCPALQCVPARCTRSFFVWEQMNHDCRSSPIRLISHKSHLKRKKTRATVFLHFVYFEHVNLALQVLAKSPEALSAASCAFEPTTPPLPSQQTRTHTPSRESAHPPLLDNTLNVNKRMRVEVEKEYRAVVVGRVPAAWAVTPAVLRCDIYIYIYIYIYIHIYIYIYIHIYIYIYIHIYI